MVSTLSLEQGCYSRTPPLESSTPNQGDVDPPPKGIDVPASTSMCLSLDLGSTNVQAARKRRLELLVMSDVVDRQVDKEHDFMQINGAATKKRRLPTSVDDVVLMAKALLPSAEHESVSAVIRKEGIDGEF